MEREHEVYLEVGRKRVFAGAIDWPGWCRAGRDEEAALLALVAYGPRYEAGLGPAARGFAPPTDEAQLRVVERLEGNATTDFGAPSASPASDERPLHAAELKRQGALLRACWAAFDRVAEAATSAVLRKGPRGGGRDLDAIVPHVRDADYAYLLRLGGMHPKAVEGDVTADMDRLRRAILDALASRARGEPLPQSRRSAKVWTPRYAVRRSAWHALDHAWEVEDRATTG